MSQLKINYVAQSREEFESLEKGLNKLLENFVFEASYAGEFPIIVKRGFPFQTKKAIEIRPDNEYGDHAKIKSVLAKDNGSGRIYNVNPEHVQIKIEDTNYLIHYSAEKKAK